MNAGAPLVGRAVELDWLLGWMYRPGPPAVLIQGEPGMGKSRLVAELSDRARLRRTPRVFISRSAALTREEGAFGRVTAILRGASEDAPVLMVYEDVHGMTASSLDVLDHLMRADFRHVRCLITAGVNQGPPELVRLVTAAVQDRLLDVLPLEPLPLAAVQELTAAILGRAPPAGLAERILRLAGGNPLLVEELARHEADGGGPPASRLLIEPGRKAEQPSRHDARTVVQGLAAAGGAAPHPMLMAVTDLTDEHFEAALPHILRSGPVEVTADGLGYRFRHEYARQACYDALLPAERIRLHSRCAAWLARSARGGARTAAADVTVLRALIHHYECAADNDAALDWALTAATDAERAGELREALDFSRKALELWPVSSRPRTARLHLSMQGARLASAVGDHATALHLVEQALADVDPVEEPLVAGALEERLVWLRLLTLSGPIPEDCGRALELIPAQPATPERARVLATHSRLLALSGRPGQAVQAAEESLAAAAELGSEGERAAAVISLGAAYAASSEPDQALELLRQGCELARSANSVEVLATGYVVLLALQLLIASDLNVVVELAASGNDVLVRQGLREGHLDLYAAAAQAELGQWQRARETAHRVEGGMARFAQWLVMLLDLRCGEEPSPPDDALSPARLDDLPALASKWCGEWLAETELLHGHPAQAAAVVARVLRRLDGRPEEAFAGRLLTLGLRAQADLATSGRDVGDSQLIIDATKAAAGLAVRADRIHPHPFDAAGSRSGTAVADGATWDAEWSRLEGSSRPQAWESAVQAWSALARPYYAAYARCREAEALMTERANRRSVGPVVLQGLTLARELGATPLQRELERLARQAHLPASLDGDDGALAGSAHTAALTRREIDVLRLAAQGLSNRAIARALVLSPKTIDTHMSHVLLKLAAHDRNAAAARAHRLGLLD